MKLPEGGYRPNEIEAKWTMFWHTEGGKLFDLQVNPTSPNYSIAIPPVNITGNLHMGHALNGTLQDVLIRLKRMQGYNVLWQPGTDHAGISTQMVVERQLMQEGIDRHQLGREQFVERVWQWYRTYDQQIMQQYKRLGVSFNWNRLAFTLTDSYVKAVYHAFVTLFKEGYVYRGNRITNWCMRCKTGLSDLEVEHQETAGHLYCIRYELSDGSDVLTVATTRPETMFGDMAVSVHPNDERYGRFIGKTAKIPLTGRVIPIIGDTHVDPQFGTGAVKVTPAHDPNDWEIAQRHGLECMSVIDTHGRLMSSSVVPEQYHLKDRLAVRDALILELKQQGFLQEIRDHTLSVAHCERCHTVIEPLLTDQWYIAMKHLAALAINAVEEKRVTFIPGRYAATYLDRLHNIREWCVSRQLWWGHRIPVWTCKQCGHVEAFEENPERCTQCHAPDLEQDPDVLDTWFSAALWPFATLGWPANTSELQQFYPTNVLSTAREIIHLWVARMIFMSEKFLGMVPFREVLIHPVVQTADGRRMSKSKGTGIDPLDTINRHGADANRFYFTSIGVTGDQDVRFQEGRIEEARRFANKIWNAARFVLAQLDEVEGCTLSIEKLTLADKWILSRYHRTLDRIRNALEHYEFGQVTSLLYQFTWNDLCDWYLEIAKVQISNEGLQGADGQTKIILQTVFEGLLRALHPVMPFITEELWQYLSTPDKGGQLSSIMFAQYPEPDHSFIDQSVEEEMTGLFDIVRAIRSIRQTLNVPASAEVGATIVCDLSERQILTEGNADIIARLAKISPLELAGDVPLTDTSATIVIGNIKVYLDPGLLNVEKSRTHMLQQRERVARDIARLQQLLDRPEFRSRAPADRIASREAELQELCLQLNNIDVELEPVRVTSGATTERSET